MFAGYIGSSNETIILQDFFRTLPVIIENRVVQTEWSLVIKLSNQIFKVIYFLQHVVFLYQLYSLYVYHISNISRFLFQYIKDNSHENIGKMNYSIMAKDFYEKTLVYLSSTVLGTQKSMVSPLLNVFALFRILIHINDS